MANIDPNQTADKLIGQRAAASAGYKGAAVRNVLQQQAVLMGYSKAN